MKSLAAPEPVDWTLASEPTPEGVRVHLIVPGRDVDAAIALTREEARAFAHAVLADAGDGTMRTFPHASYGGASG